MRSTLRALKEVMIRIFKVVSTGAGETLVATSGYLMNYIDIGNQRLWINM